MALDLVTAIQDAEAALSRKRQAIQVLLQDVELLEQEIHGLKLAVSRHGGTPTPTATLPGLTEDDHAVWQRLNRSEAVFRMLQKCGQPVGPTDLAKMLKQVGREGDTPNYVAAALAYLNRTNKIRSVGRAQWIPLEPNTNGSSDTEGAG